MPVEVKVGQPVPSQLSGWPSRGLEEVASLAR